MRFIGLIPIILLQGCITITQTSPTTTQPIELHLNITLPSGRVTEAKVEIPKPVIRYVKRDCQPTRALVKIPTFNVMQYMDDSQQLNLVQAALERIKHVDTLIAKIKDC